MVRLHIGIDWICMARVNLDNASSNAVSTLWSTWRISQLSLLTVDVNVLKGLDKIGRVTDRIFIDIIGDLYHVVRKNVVVLC